jgi:hypothetical protein
VIRSGEFPVIVRRWARSATPRQRRHRVLLGRTQTELLNRRRWNTRVELANATFEYLEIFHDRP